MKSFCIPWDIVALIVAPFAGAWIEIMSQDLFDMLKDVAPFAGAWIEMSITASLISAVFVAPFAGAWIEIAIPLSVS